MTPKWDLIGLGGDLGDFWIVVSWKILDHKQHNGRT
jgi:hypothetical protein